MDERAERERHEREAQELIDAAIEKAELDGDGERKMFGETPVEYAQRMLEQGLIDAIEGIIHTCRYAENEKTRFEASKYLLDRAFGSTSPTSGKYNDTEDPLSVLLEKVLKKD